jgi:LPS sulfotransferase NodH
MSIAAPRFVKPKNSYIICTSPRSGSWLLADGLQSTNIAGRPREWFHKVAEEERSKRQGMPLPSETGYTSYMDYVIRAATTSNGVFGLKCHWYQLELLPAKLATIDGFQGVPMPIALPRLFPNLKFIWLTRKNKIRQAISLDKARQTGAWWHEDSFPKKLDVSGEPAYDPIMIDQAERHLLANEIGWRDFFKACNAKPYLVVYEDLVEKYDETLRKVMRFLELPEADSVTVPPPRVKKQADDKTESWMEDYLTFQRNKKNGTQPPVKPLTGRPGMRPAEWRRQIGQSKLVGLMDPAIIDMLTVQGVPRNVAETEVRRAANNPFLQAGHEVGQRLRRMEMLLHTYGELSKLDSRNREIERRGGLTADDFVSNYYAANRPVVMTDAATEWAELKDWNPDRLKSLAPEQKVEIAVQPRSAEKGRTSEPERKSFAFPEFVDMIANGSEAHNLCFSARYDFFKKTDSGSPFDGLPILSEFLDLAQTREGLGVGMEPSEFHSRLRSEPLNVLILQLCGKKTVKLIPSYQMDLVYGGQGRMSEVDIRNPDYSRFPKFRDATVIEVELQPGEALFVPVGWWHAEKTTGVNISMTFTNFKATNHFDRPVIETKQSVANLPAISV